MVNSKFFINFALLNRRNMVNNTETQPQEAQAILKHLPSPKEIYNMLDKYVIGQDAAKRTLSVAVYNHYKRIFSMLGYIPCKEEFKDVVIDKSNILMVGNTGTGKTYMIKKIAEQMQVPCYIADVTKVTESGYVGDDVETLLVGLLHECDYNVSLAECGIVILDEVDKLSRKSDNPSITRDVGGEGVQQSLLKIVEGSVIGVPPHGGRKHPDQPLVYIDTTNILFIGLGAFEGIERHIERRLNKNRIGYNSHIESKSKTDDILSHVESNDLRSFGMIPELIGRFPVVTYTNPLSKDDLVRIIKEPQNSILSQYQKLLSFDDITLSFTDGALKMVAEYGYKLKTGARGLRGVIEKILMEVMFDFADKKNTSIVIDENYVSNVLHIEKKREAA